MLFAWCGAFGAPCSFRFGSRGRSPPGPRIQTYYPRSAWEVTTPYAAISLSSATRTHPPALVVCSTWTRTVVRTRAALVEKVACLARGGARGREGAARGASSMASSERALGAPLAAPRSEVSQRGQRARSELAARPASSQRARSEVLARFWPEKVRSSSELLSGHNIRAPGRRRAPGELGRQP